MTRATKIVCFLGFCLVFISGTYGQGKGLQLIKEWTNLTWSYATAAEEQQAITNGEYIVQNCEPVDTDAYYGANGFTKIFVTVPRQLNGVPGTLNTISSSSVNPKLTPYPSWEWNRNSSACQPDRLVSVFRTQIDDCGRLWVLDTGKIGTDQLCNAQVIAFDPSTDKVLHRFEIPLIQMHELSKLLTPIVDVRDPERGCRDTFVYVADETGFGLIVIDILKNKSWRIENKLFYPSPEFGTFNVAGVTFDVMDGIHGMALSPYKPGGDRLLYFHSLSSNTENYVLTSVLRNETLFLNNPNAVPRQFKVFQSKRPSQAGAEAIDRNGVMYFGLVHEITMNCWNTHTDYNERNFGLLGNNPVTLQFTSGVKIINNRKGGQELWVMTDRYQRAVTGTLNLKDINFRIFAAATEVLLRGSKCKYPREAPTKPIGGSNGLLTHLQQGWGGIFSNN